MLVNRANKPNVRLADWGSSVGGPGSSKLYGKEGPSRNDETWDYSPPEALLGTQDFNRSCAYDMWSLGALVLEMILGRPVSELFAVTSNRVFAKMERDARNQGEDEETINMRRRLQGMRDFYLENGCITGEAFLLLLHERDYANGFIDPDTVSFLCQLLQWNPSERISAEDALRHPWLLELTGEILEKGAFTMIVASHAEKGLRENQEDAVSSHKGVFGIFDGHLGGQVSKAAAAEIPMAIADGLSFADAFEQFDKKMEPHGAGSTALIAKIGDDHLLEVANIGDCRAVMAVKHDARELITGRYIRVTAGRWTGEEGHVIHQVLRPTSKEPYYLVDLVNTGKSHLVAETALQIVHNIDALQITEDHKPDLERERKRIEALGGFVTTGAVPRLNDKYSTSRAIGGYGPLKHFLGDPRDVDVFQLPLNSSADFIVLGTDGLWGTLSNQYVVEYVYNQLREKSQDIKDSINHVRDAAHELVDQALSHGSTDNVAVTIIDLRWN